MLVFFSYVDTLSLKLSSFCLQTGNEFKLTALHTLKSASDFESQLPSQLYTGNLTVFQFHRMVPSFSVTLANYPCYPFFI